MAIIGAGMSGAACARAIADAGHAVTVFEQAQRPGGRASTWTEHGHSFDAGAQDFSVRDERFGRLTRSLLAEGTLAKWRPDRYLGVPDMSALFRRLLHDLDVHWSTRVGALSREAERWRLKDEHGASLGEFDAAVVAAPAPTASSLISPASYAMAAKIDEIRWAPCLAATVVFEQSLETEASHAELPHGALRWVARESSKPSRGPPERWVLHGSADFSERHFDDAAEAVLPVMLDAFFASTGVSPVPATESSLRGFRHAEVLAPLGTPCLFDEALRLAACGDWCLGARLESAYLSGCAAAGRINSLTVSPADSPAPLRDPAQLRLV